MTNFLNLSENASTKFFLCYTANNICVSSQEPANMGNFSYLPVLCFGMQL